MPLHGGICEYDPEHGPLPVDFSDPELAEWFPTWLALYRRRFEWDFFSYGPLPPISPNLPVPALAPSLAMGPPVADLPSVLGMHSRLYRLAGRPMCPMCQMVLVGDECPLDPAHDVSNPLRLPKPAAGNPRHQSSQSSQSSQSKGHQQHQYQLRLSDPTEETAAGTSQRPFYPPQSQQSKENASKPNLNLTPKSNPESRQGNDTAATTATSAPLAGSSNTNATAARDPQAQARSRLAPCRRNGRAAPIPESIESWLREMDEVGFLMPYYDRLAAVFDSPGQVADVYAQGGTAGATTLDPKFFDDIGITKVGHRRLFEKWFADNF